MTIQAWLAGEPVQLRSAEQGIYSKITPSTTVSLVGATLIPSDLILCGTLGAAGAVKVLGGTDTGNGPCTLGDTLVIANHTGQNLTIYPNNSLGTVKNQSAGTGFLIATGLVAYLTYFGSDNWSLNAS